MELNAKGLKKALISAYNNLYNFYPEIDKLNVFPVPDGDTGTNMNLTMNNAIVDIEQLDDNTSLFNVADVFARGLIMGARGNSGVILSQIFRGFADGLKNYKELSLDAIKESFMLAKEVAYKAVMKPVEGTILTVIRETAENLAEITTTKKVNELFILIVDFANAALNKTPDLLPVLKEVGVVDSGGFGLVKILEGMSHFFETNKIVNKHKKLSDFDHKTRPVTVNLAEDGFGYCTETVILLNDTYLNKLDINKVRINLEDKGGKSIVAVVDKDILKIHVHTIIPGIMLTFLQQYGEFKTVKVENMNLQAKKYVHNFDQKRKLVHDQALIAVSPSVGITNFFFNELNIKQVINGGSSMNPSTDDFLQAIYNADAKEIFLLPNNSNAVLAANQAAKLEKQSEVHVVPTTSIQEGMVAALSFEFGESAKKNNNLLKNAIKNVISVTITKSVRTTLIDGVQINKNDFMSIINHKITFSNPNFNTIIKDTFDKVINKTTEIITIFVGEDANEKDVELIKKVLEESFDVEYEFIDGDQQVYSFIIAVE